MKVQVDNYTIESDSYGYRLTVTKPSSHVKSKTGFKIESTFHANLHQVAAKMMHHEISASDAGAIKKLAEDIDCASDRLAYWLEKSK